MSYQTQWALTYDDAFVSRGRAALTNQAGVFKDDARPDMAALAGDILRGVTEPLVSFQSLLGAAPGFADTADNGDGSVDSSLIPDNDILAAIQADWPTVAQLYYAADGTPL